MSDWLNELDAAHTWSERKTIHYEGTDRLWGVDTVEDIEARECTKCGALERDGSICYLSCQILTIYPADFDGPCRCTKNKYLKAHELFEKYHEY